MKKLCYTTAILRAIACSSMKQKDLAVIYILLLTRNTRASVPLINEKIIERWSEAGLLEIKRLAWEELERRDSGDMSLQKP